MIDIDDTEDVVAQAWRAEVFLLATLQLLMDIIDAGIMAPNIGMPSACKTTLERFESYLIVASGLFDSNYYTSANSDVVKLGADPLDHYFRHGGIEGRKPGPLFDGAAYLTRYTDVHAAGLNPLVHYITRGIVEGRTLEAPKIHPKPRAMTHHKQFDDLMQSEMSVLAVISNLCLKYQSVTQEFKVQREKLQVLRKNLDTSTAKAYVTSAKLQRMQSHNGRLMRDISTIQRDDDRCVQAESHTIKTVGRL